MSTQPPSINLEPVKKWMVYIISILALIVSVLTAINTTLPAQIGEPPIVVSNQGVSNLDTLQVGDGSLTEPAFGFTADPDNGLYRIGTNNIGIAAGGTKILDVSASGAAIVGTFSPSGLLNADGGIAVDTSAFTVADTSGNTQIAGTLGVTGATTLVGALGANGGLSVDTTAFTVADTSGNTQIAGTLGVTGAVTIQNVTTINANLDVDSFSTAGNMDITTMNNTGANPVTVNDDLNITGTLSISNVAFSGVEKWGTAATYDSGTSITHGFATTPTVCFIQPIRDVTATLTITATGFSSDMASVAEPIYWMCGQ